LRWVGLDRGECSENKLGSAHTSDLGGLGWSIDVNLVTLGGTLWRGMLRKLGSVGVHALRCMVMRWTVMCACVWEDLARDGWQEEQVESEARDRWLNLVMLVGPRVSW
jgi:hypothetical protein